MSLLSRTFFSLATTLALPAVLGAAGLAFTASAAHAQVAQAAPQGQGANLWAPIAQVPPQVLAGREWVRARRAQHFMFDLPGMRALLAAAPLEFAGGNPLRIALPDPDGNWQLFDVFESPMVEPALAAQNPWLKTYAGQGVNDPTATVRIDLTSLGFRAQVLGEERNYAIDPVTFENTMYLGVYDLGDLARPVDPFVCHVQDDAGPPSEDSPFATRTLGTQLRNYRLAVAATQSYSSFYGNNAVNALSGIVTTVNRMNQIFERDFAVRFTLVANNNLLIYITTSPYTDGTLSSMLNENQTNLTAVIGGANYDIGHVFCALNVGGLAARPSACNATNKARGGTGLTNPTGDFWTIQYVSHEIGHQMGARHSFNAGDGTAGVCEPNRSASSAYEPGSGTTIMSYRGLCGSANNLPATDAMFNQGAYADIRAHITGAGNCAALTNTGNTLPVITGLVNRNVPRLTALTVSATATDADGDALTYSWEQRNLGAPQPITGAGSEDNGASPLFRVFAPSTNNTRFLPLYADVLDGSLTLGEQYPSLARAMVLRLTVRDNRAAGGGTVFGDVTYNVSGTAGPFRLTSFNTTGQSVSAGPATITWDVAGTDAAPISTSNVRLTLSTDNGATWPIELAASTPNDGTQDVTIPSLAFTASVRFRIEAVGNVYYDVTDVAQTVACPTVPSVTTTNECSRVVINWGLVSGSTNYRVLRALAATPTTTTQIASVSSTTTVFNDTTAVAGTAYVYYVRMVSSACSAGGPLGTAVAGQRLQAPTISQNPASQTLASGSTFTLNVVAPNATGYQWTRDNVALVNGSGVSGADTATLTITNVQSGQSGLYRCVASNACASLTSSAATITVTGQSCDSIDFNRDGLFPDDADLIDFLSVLAGGACSTAPSPGCNDIDFNNDGLFPDDSDLLTFLTVLAGQPC